LTHVRHNLTIGQFVGHLQFGNATGEIFALDSFFELQLRFAGTEDQNCVGIAKACDDLVVVLVEVNRELALKLILVQT
jgi:hypothetical protein